MAAIEYNRREQTDTDHQEKLFQVECYCGLGNCERALGNLTVAKLFYERAEVLVLSLAETLEVMTLGYQLSLNIGIYYLCQHRYSNAVFHLAKAWGLAEQTHQPAFIATANSYYGLALICVKNKSLDWEANSFLRRATKKVPAAVRETSLDWVQFRFNLGRASEIQGFHLPAYTEFKETYRLLEEIMTPKCDSYTLWYGSLDWTKKRADTAAGLGRVSQTLKQWTDAVCYLKDAAYQYRLINKAAHLETELTEAACNIAVEAKKNKTVEASTQTPSSLFQPAHESSVEPSASGPSRDPATRMEN
jgi:tetratricopeptide (TPR) repeat protein